MTRAIRCPLCRKETYYENNPFRPFCSERCKLIDLGQWASGEYTIKGEPTEQAEDTLSNEMSQSEDN